MLLTNMVKVERRRKESGCIRSMFLTALDMGVLDVAQYSLDTGANVDETEGSYAETALHTCARYNKLRKIDLLIRNHANLEATDSRGATPLFDAISNGNIKAIQRLVRAGANVNAQSPTKWTPLHEACTLSMPKAKIVLDLLLLGGVIPDLANSSGRTAMHDIAARGYSTCIDALMIAHFDINAKDNNGMTPLHHAATWQNSDMVSTLLRYHADINAQDKNGCTALHLAAKNADAKTVEVLLENSARTDIENELGQTPLQLLALSKFMPIPSSQPTAPYVPNGTECPVCYQEVPREALAPCGHFVCSACIKKLSPRICPICRKKIESTIKTLFQ